MIITLVNFVQTTYVRRNPTFNVKAYMKISDYITMVIKESPPSNLQVDTLQSAETGRYNVKLTLKHIKEVIIETTHGFDSEKGARKFMNKLIEDVRVSSFNVLSALDYA